MNKRKHKTTLRKAEKGFGVQKQPRLWIQVVYVDEDRPSRFVRLNCTDTAAERKAQDILRNRSVAECIFLRGSADIEDVNARDILAAVDRMEEL